MVVIRAINFAFTLLITGISFGIWDFKGFMIALTIAKITLTFTYWADTKFVLKKYAISLWDLIQQFVLTALIFLVNYFLFQLIALIDLNWLVTIIERIVSFLPIDVHDQIIILLNNGIQIFTFAVLFVTFVIFFRVITKDDLIMLENAKLRIPFKKMLKKILRDKRENSFSLPV